MHDGCAAESTASVLQFSQIFPGSSLSVTVLLNTNWGENGDKDESLFPLLYVFSFNIIECFLELPFQMCYQGPVRNNPLSQTETYQTLWPCPQNGLLRHFQSLLRNSKKHKKGKTVISETNLSKSCNQ